MSCLDTISGSAKWRLRFGDFFSRMWLENECRALTLPFAVSLKRFLAPEWVFIFGIGAESKADGLSSDG